MASGVYGTGHYGTDTYAEEPAGSTGGGGGASAVSGPSRLPVLAAAPVTIRHISRGTGTGAVTVLGASFVAQSRRGLDGRRGYESGSYETVVNDEGTGTLKLPNTTGPDGILHRRRFAILTDPAYHPGDEWIEIEQDGHPLWVGTPVDRELTRSTLTLQLADALWIANTQRETAAGFWAHAPRDVFEHYTKAWVPVVAEDFADLTGWAGANATVVDGGARLVTTGAGDPGAAYINADPSMWGTIGLNTDRSWRLETRYEGPLPDSAQVSVGMVDFATNLTYVRLTAGMSESFIQIRPTGTEPRDSEMVKRPQPRQQTGVLAIECRDRWVLFYVDGALVFSCELDITDSAPAVPQVAAWQTTTPAQVDVRSVLLRSARPYLMRAGDPGDYRLPSLPSGGLKGAYYDEADLRQHGPGPTYSRRALAPTRQPYARRLDATISFALANPPAWQPPTPPNGEFFSVRWTGSIYLDLAAADVQLTVTQLDDAAVRLWIGKTMYGQQLIDQWLTATGTLTTGSLRAHLGTQSGWYPIRLDFAQGSGAGGIVLQRSIGGGAWESIPASELSPYGIYEAQVRYDSHAEQLKAIALAYGLQYRCEPRSLESGAFPGEVVPRVRVGRDTDKVLTPDESTEVSVKGSAGEVIDALLADAAGLADQANQAQLTAESVNFDALTSDADGHLAVLSAYESLADITDPVLLQTRLASMLGLRVTPWEEINARPRGHTELRDTFPLTGDIGLFQWEPGDGLRVVDDQLDLRDDTPRALIGVSWQFGPDGRGAPSVRFRQRPRSQQDALRALVRATLLPQRNYQGQLAIVNGTSSATDSGYSRVALPADLGDVKRCELVVTAKSDASVWTIWSPPGITAVSSFASVGRISLLPYLNRRSDSVGAVGPGMIINASGTGTAEYQLELLVSV